MTTIEAAKALGLAVRSVQLMADRGELVAWKTPGGHRRIAAASVMAWKAQGAQQVADPGGPANAPAVPEGVLHALLIEDSVHYQNLIRLVLAQHFPDVQLTVESDGISGLVAYGKRRPDVLLVDILLPGIDGPTLISKLRLQPGFNTGSLVVVTSLAGGDLDRFAYALRGIAVINKSDLLTRLPQAFAAALVERGKAA